jgi:multidrug efflux pump
LIMSQMLTLYTTPVVYLYLDRLRIWWEKSGQAHTGSAPQESMG